jgi:hypothetical protein
MAASYARRTDASTKKITKEKKNTKSRPSSEPTSELVNVSVCGTDNNWSFHTSVCKTWESGSHFIHVKADFNQNKV